MKLHQLRDLVAVARRGSLRAAARQLGIAQPAITRSIHGLERELGAPLFERRAHGMALTPMGELLLARADVVLGEVRRAREEIEQWQGGTAGQITVCLSLAPHIALLPYALTECRKRYPRVVINLIEGFFPTIERELKDGRVDFYVGPVPATAIPSEFTMEKLFDNSRTVLGRRGHPLAGATSLADLIGAEWITTSITHKAEEELGAVFAKEGLTPPRLAMKAQSALSLLVALAYTDLLAMVPVQWADFELTRRTLARIDIGAPISAPEIVLVQRAGLPLTPAAGYFGDMLRRAAAPYAARRSDVAVRTMPRGKTRAKRK